MVEKLGITQEVAKDRGSPACLGLSDQSSSHLGSIGLAPAISALSINCFSMLTHVTLPSTEATGHM